MSLDYAGEFTVRTARIIGVAGDFIDITPNLMMIKIYEDITLPAIYGELMMSSSISHADMLPIIGQEELELHISTPGFEDTSDFNFANIDKRFSIYALENRQHHALTTQTMVLKFCSTELLKSNLTTFSRVEKGKYSDIVKKIMSEDIETKKDLNIEETEGLKKMVLPFKHPFEVISQAAAYSVSEANKTTSFLFFENREGFHFRSLPDIYKEDIVWQYTLNSEGLKQEKGGTDIGSDLQTLTGLNMSHNNRLTNTSDGCLGSTTITHDIFNKQYNIKSYQYFDKFFKYNIIL